MLCYCKTSVVVRHHSINQDKTNYAHAVWCKELICYELRQCHELIDWDCRFSTDNERSSQLVFNTLFQLLETADNVHNDKVKVMDFLGKSY